MRLPRIRQEVITWLRRTVEIADGWRLKHSDDHFPLFFVFQIKQETNLLLGVSLLLGYRDKEKLFEVIVDAPEITEKNLEKDATNGRRSVLVVDINSNEDRTELKQLWNLINQVSPRDSDLED